MGAWFDPNRPVSLADDGFLPREIPVVRFLSNDTDRKWFMRQQETLAYVTHPFDGPAPYDEKELLAYVRDNFGSDACAIY